MHKSNEICKIWHAIFSRQSPDGPWRTSVNTDSKKKSVAACMRMDRLVWGNSFIFSFCWFLSGIDLLVLPALLQQWKAEVRDMLSDASVERQCQLCAQYVSENYDEERLEEFVKESHQTPSPDDWGGKMGEDEARMLIHLQTVNLQRTDPWLGIHGEQCTMEDITRWVKKKCRDWFYVYFGGMVDRPALVSRRTTLFIWFLDLWRDDIIR